MLFHLELLIWLIILLLVDQLQTCCTCTHQGSVACFARTVMNAANFSVFQLTFAINSLQDGTSKMSKSDENDNSRINMTDDPKLIEKKIKSAKTDAFKGLEWDNDERPECQNLLSIYSIVTEKSKDDIAAEVADMSWGSFKPILAEAVVEHLKPFQAKYAEVMDDRGELDRILLRGAHAANIEASVTCERVRDAMGFLPPLASE